MNKKNLSVVVLSISICMLFMLSCKKDKKDVDMIFETDVINAQDNSAFQSAFDDIFKASEDAMSKNNGARLYGGPGVNFNCVNITIDTLSNNPFIRRFTIHFTSGCRTYDGKSRSGSLIVELSGDKYNETGSVTTITTNNYQVEGVKIEGRKTITCVEPGKHNIQVTGINGTGYAKITYTDGKTAEWKSTRTRTQTAGSNTPLNIFDNKFEISGTNGNSQVAEGINRDGGRYTVNIESPLVIDFTCEKTLIRYPTSGVLVITPEGKSARKIDYGTGTCDSRATISVAGFSKEINLP
ncbi:MAG: hypothetical protein NZ529_00540 [Cytophagaceae bacterium]|nr:hypothetical protein [Cytophagaceae bacterium]MDW8455251.1 hypothetical protein [Cytophagaceae bacterium]